MKCNVPLYVVFIGLVGLVRGLYGVPLPNHGDVALDVSFAPGCDVVWVRHHGPLVIELMLWDRRWGRIRVRDRPTSHGSLYWLVRKIGQGDISSLDLDFGSCLGMHTKQNLDMWSKSLLYHIKRLRGMPWARWVLLLHSGLCIALCNTLDLRATGNSFTRLWVNGANIQLEGSHQRSAPQKVLWVDNLVRNKQRAALWAWCKALALSLSWELLKINELLKVFCTMLEPTDHKVVSTTDEGALKGYEDIQTDIQSTYTRVT